MAAFGGRKYTSKRKKADKQSFPRAMGLLHPSQGWGTGDSSLTLQGAPRISGL